MTIEILEKTKWEPTQWGSLEELIEGIRPTDKNYMCIHKNYIYFVALFVSDIVVYRVKINEHNS